MGWIRLDDAFTEHPKYLRVGPLGGYLNIAAIAWSNRNLTDGFIPIEQVHRLVNFAWMGEVAAEFSPIELANELVDVGLWEESAESGYVIHDYHDWQQSRTQILDARKGARERQSRSRARRHLQGKPAVTDKSQKRHAVSHGPVTALKKEEVRSREGKPSLTSAPPTPEIRSLALQLAEHIRRNDPKAQPKPESKRWLTDMRLLLKDRDGDVAEVQRIIDACQADSFWRSNILSPGKLRKHFTQLMLRADSGQQAGVNPALPEWQRPRPEWIEQAKAHLEAQGA